MLTALLLMLSVAFADDNAAANSDSSVATAVAAAPDRVWTTDAVPLQRWADSSDVVVVTLAPETRLDVLVRDGDQLRVRRGMDFGWVPADKVSSTEPTVDLGGLGAAPVGL